MWLWTNSEMLDLSNNTPQMTYTIQIPLQTTIELEVIGGQVMSYSDILAQITEVDLKEASLHLPIEGFQWIHRKSEDSLLI